MYSLQFVAQAILHCCVSHLARETMPGYRQKEKRRKLAAGEQMVQSKLSQFLVHGHKYYGAYFSVDLHYTFTENVLLNIWSLAKVKHCL